MQSLHEPHFRGPQGSQPSRERQDTREVLQVGSLSMSTFCSNDLLSKGIEIRNPFFLAFEERAQLSRVGLSGGLRGSSPRANGGF
jgi:hypothetical protein